MNRIENRLELVYIHSVSMSLLNSSCNVMVFSIQVQTRKTSFSDNMVADIFLRYYFRLLTDMTDLDTNESRFFHFPGRVTGFRGKGQRVMSLCVYGGCY